MNFGGVNIEDKFFSTISDYFGISSEQCEMLYRNEMDRFLQTLPDVVRSDISEDSGALPLYVILGGYFKNKNKIKQEPVSEDLTRDARAKELFSMGFTRIDHNLWSNCKYRPTCVVDTKHNIAYIHYNDESIIVKTIQDGDIAGAIKFLNGIKSDMYLPFKESYPQDYVIKYMKSLGYSKFGDFYSMEGKDGRKLSWSCEMGEIVKYYGYNSYRKVRYDPSIYDAENWDENVMLGIHNILNDYHNPRISVDTTMRGKDLRHLGFYQVSTDSWKKPISGSVWSIVYSTSDGIIKISQGGNGALCHRKVPVKWDKSVFISAVNECIKEYDQHNEFLYDSVRNFRDVAKSLS